MAPSHTLRSTPLIPCHVVFGEGSGKEKKNLSAAEQERRDEEKRRNERKDDVVIGKTSAKPGATDYALDPNATREKYLNQASRIEQDIFRLTEEGLSALNLLQIDEAELAFDRVFELKADAYLWQAGIVKYYQGKLDEAADIFARSAETFETKFGGIASEERIWRAACELRILNQMSNKERKRIVAEGGLSSSLRAIPDRDTDPESRRVLRIAKALFSASVDSDLSLEIMSRAKLRSIGGSTKEAQKMDLKGWKLSSWYYLGLNYDAIGEEEESKKCMMMALKMCPSSGKSNDIIHTLPLLHMTARDWFDDSDFDSDPMETEKSCKEDRVFSPKKPSNAIATSMAYADPLIEESIKNGVSKMKLEELREALRLRGLTTVGSKETLQERLFYSLMDDAGFSSGFAP